LLHQHIPEPANVKTFDFQIRLEDMVTDFTVVVVSVLMAIPSPYLLLVSLL
jgi:hypothetical protein